MIFNETTLDKIAAFLEGMQAFNQGIDKKNPYTGGDGLEWEAGWEWAFEVSGESSDLEATFLAFEASL